jgi:cytochrome oxidase Cu insertion factor (SCO1/SenC/PrrC family)
MLKTILFAAAFVAATVAPVAAPAADAVAKRSTPVAVGDVAPDFTLGDQQGRPHTLSAQRGKGAVVLVFYRGHW